jgi:hypothetical protein
VAVVRLSGPARADKASPVESLKVPAEAVLRSVADALVVFVRSDRERGAQFSADFLSKLVDPSGVWRSLCRRAMPCVFAVLAWPTVCFFSERRRRLRRAPGLGLRSCRCPAWPGAHIGREQGAERVRCAEDRSCIGIASRSPERRDGVSLSRAVLCCGHLESRFCVRSSMAEVYCLPSEPNCLPSEPNCFCALQIRVLRGSLWTRS